MRSQQSACAGAAFKSQVPTGPSKELRGWGSRDRKGKPRCLPSGLCARLWELQVGPYLRGFMPVGKADVGQTCTDNCLITTEGSATEMDRQLQGWDGPQGGKLSVKGQLVNIVGFAGWRILVPTTQLCHGSVNRPQTIGRWVGVAVLPYKTGAVGLALRLPALG